jgi:BlaI family transcriptional regulator, penicillinase repressor
MADEIPLTLTLSRRERQILDIVYARGEATAAQVVKDMPDPPSKTAVRTLMRILEEKGHLTHRQEGQCYIYCPCRPRTPAGQSALRQVLRTFFGGSIQEALAAHLADDEAELKPEELGKIAALIRKARKEGR